MHVNKTSFFVLAFCLCAGSRRKLLNWPSSNLDVLPVLLILQEGAVHLLQLRFLVFQIPAIEEIVRNACAGRGRGHRVRVDGA